MVLNMDPNTLEGAIWLEAVSKVQEILSRKDYSEVKGMLAYTKLLKKKCEDWNLPGSVDNYSRIIQLLEQIGNPAAISIGSGNATKVGMVDQNRVIRLQWYTTPTYHRNALVRGLSCHSVIVVTILVNEGEDSKMSYVLEKAATNGKYNEADIMISDMEEFVHFDVDKIWTLVATAQRRQFQSAYSNICMADLYEIAKKGGPYHLASSNCHHMARAIFKTAVKRNYRPSWWSQPSYVLPRMASAFGMDPTRSRGTQLCCVPARVTFNPCKPTEYLYEDVMKRLIQSKRADVPSIDGLRAMECRDLSSWIYNYVENPSTEIPGGFQLIGESKKEECADWVVLQKSSSSEQQGPLYVIFKGTDFGQTTDVVIDMNVVLNEAKLFENELVSVHSGMWGSLSNYIKSIDDTTIKRINCLLDSREHKDLPIVICGHSLGGGYAQLFGSSRIYDASIGKHRVSRIITFGSPQVFTKPREDQHPQWDELSQVCEHYINKFDPVPRLPTQFEWVKLTIPGHQVCRSAGFGIEIAENLNSALANVKLEMVESYSHVGTLIFLSCETQQSQQIEARLDDSSHIEILNSKAPYPGIEQVGYHHQLSEYSKTMEKCLQC